MTTQSIISGSSDDAQLVERSLRGDTQAFGSLVERHQSLVCGLAYSACGNVHVSEDLAQETFITAWQQLRTLREKTNLRGWLCGIARNVIHNFLRKQQRTPTAKAAVLDEMADTSSAEPSPAENAINEQETAILWRTLQTLPPNYREPMVLYYRELESVSAVAEALDLSEDAVKQRLARGRAMLAEHVERLMGNTLRKTAPTAAFTFAVLAALPLATTSASAATAGVVLAKGSTSGKALTLTVCNAVLAPLLAIVAACVGYKVSMDSAKSEEERVLIKKFYQVVAVCGGIFGAALIVLLFAGDWLAQSHPAAFTMALIGLIAMNLLFGIGGLLWARRQNRKLPSRETNQYSARSLPVGKWGVPPLEYRSKLSLLGLPLVHMRFGRKHGEPVRAVKAWFAAGDFAIGVIGAFGAMTIAPISIGGCAIGLLSLGGLAAGVACWGGIGLGVWVIGGCALGWAAFGGCAVAWHAAEGGLAVARDFALGSSAVADHANDAIAKAAMKQDTFFQIARTAMNYAIWINVIWLLPLLLMWRKARQMKQQSRAHD
jgi:RNA polymerase sigma factor (sigma-70 family)